MDRQTSCKTHYKSVRHVRTTGRRPAGWTHLRSPRGEHRRRQPAKPRTDLKSGAQPQLNDGQREPSTLTTVQATWDVIAREPPELHVTQQAFGEARQHAELAPHTSIRKRALAGASEGSDWELNPGRESWRNGLWIDLRAWPG